MPLLAVLGGDPPEAGWSRGSLQAAAFVSLCCRGLILPLGPLMWESLPPPSLFSVTLSLSLSSEVLYLWPAPSQPAPGTLQDDEIPLSCSEASGEEALLPVLPRAGGPHPQGYRLPPPALSPFTALGSPLPARGKQTRMKGRDVTASIWVSSSGGKGAT